MADRLTEVRERAAAAIEGPWGWYGNRESNHISLATRDRGRLYIMDTHTWTEQHVFDHHKVESYTLEEARLIYLVDPETLPDKPYLDMGIEELQSLAKARKLVVKNAEDEGAAPIADDYHDAHSEYDADHDLREHYDGNARRAMEELHRFLAGDIEPEEGARHFSDYGYTLVRGVSVKDDLRFPVDGLMRTWRDLCRFEVLNGMTEDEAEADPDFTGNLYRQDIVGIDTPEAEFIAHSRDDVDYLLRVIDAQRALVMDRLDPDVAEALLRLAEAEGGTEVDR